MIKAVLIGISLLVGCFTTIFFTRYIDYRLSARDMAKQSKQNIVNNTQLLLNGSLSNSNYNESHPVIKSLTKLIEIPVIGQFFMDEKIYELARLQLWQGIINESPYVLKTPANRYNYAVWYHKALAECNLNMLEECEETVKELEMMAGNRYHRRYSAQFYEQLNNLKKGKGKKSTKKLLEL